jgi:hypothetical protein
MPNGTSTPGPVVKPDRPVLKRAGWANSEDAALLRDCDIDTYRASGPGGQKRNKTSSAVRLRHRPSGIIVIAEESRSQHENKAKALRRLRREIWLTIREPAGAAVNIGACRTADGRLVARPKSAGYLPAVAELLDVLEEAAGSVRDAAGVIGTTTANLVSFLQSDRHSWRAVGILRGRHGLPPLHD